MWLLVFCVFLLRPLIGLQCVIMTFPGHIHLFIVIKYFNCTNESGVSLFANLNNIIVHSRFYVLMCSRKAISFLLFYVICFKIYLDVFIYAENTHIDSLFYVYLFGFSSLFHTFYFMLNTF